MMIKKTRGRNGGDRATPETSKRPHPTPIRCRVKAAIVWLAVFGLLPVGFASWLIQRGRLKDA